jgi:hypothetical protein
MSSWGYYVSGSFLYVATTNIFNFIALLSAVLLILDPILFTFHSGYNYYVAYKAQKVADASGKPVSRIPPRGTRPVVWWKWYAVSATIHLLDAWFFRSIIPFFERARANQGQPANDLQDLADITRILWGIVRSLSLFVISLEVWEKRLVLRHVLGQQWNSPKWGFAIVYFIAPGIIALSAVPVVAYFVALALWNSTGFLWFVIKDAFTPDWRHGQDVFVARITETVTEKVATATEAPGWKFWA